MTRDRSAEPRSDRDAPAPVVCWLTSKDPASTRPDVPPGVSLAIGTVAGGTREDAATIELPEHATVAHLANRAAERWPRSDLVLVFPGVTAEGDWLELLRECVESESTAATASAFSEAQLRRSRGGALPGLPPGSRLPAAPRRALNPRLDLPQPTIIWLKRAALDLIGPLDESLRTNEGALAAYGLAARGLGLANLLADGLVVAAPHIDWDPRDRATLVERDPSFESLLGRPQSPAVERAATQVALSSQRLSVTFDARALGPAFGGTQVYILELLSALAASGELSLRILIGPGLPAEVTDRLSSLADTRLLTYEEALQRPAPSDIVHRPQQVFSPDDLLLLRPLGRRLVITHHDLIAYHNPAYFPDLDHWERFLRTTASALSVADRVLFFSRHALADAAREDLVENERCAVAELGGDARVTLESLSPAAADAPPAGLPRLSDTGFVLCIGADYRHKNRPFAIALVDELRRRGWAGSLVLAGPHVAHGGSAEAERRVERERALPPGVVLDLPAVTAEQRSWLLANAAAIAYPTVDEGFGLVPFDAAAVGVPCLFAAQSSLGELFPPESALLVPWDAARSAERAAPVLESGGARSEHVERLRAAASIWRWSRCAELTIQVYRDALSSPSRSPMPDGWQALERESEIVRLDEGARALTERVHELTDGFGSDALALVGPDALLSRADQRALLSATTRPAAKRALFGALRLAYRAAHRTSSPGPRGGTPGSGG